MSRRWTRDELALLDDWTGNNEDLAVRLGRTVQAVRHMRARRLDPDATAEKTRAYAETNRHRMAGKALLYQRINRDQINARIRAKAAADRAAATQTGPYQPHEDAIILQLDLSAPEVAQQLGRTPSSVRQRRAKLIARAR